MKNSIKNKLTAGVFTMALFIISGSIIVACSDSDTQEPLENNPEAPGVVHNVSVENQPGKARITYALPEEQDLLYVKAEYTLATGKSMEVKASYYENSVLVEGFADTLEHEVKLYAVNRSEVASEPVAVTVKPQEAPLWDVYKSLHVGAAFGGVYVNAENPYRSDVAILIMQKNEHDEWEINPNSIYSSTDSISHTLRGLDTLKQDFAFTVRDRWLNYSDTLYTSISPLYEAAIPQSGYNGMNLPGDAPRHPSTSMSGMWDGNIIDWPSIYMTQAAHPGEHVITFDIGQLAKLSRIVIWDYPEYYNGRTYYYLHCMYRFEIWGSDDPPADGSFDNWHLLGTYQETKPSGLPYGEQNDEDYRAANAGFSWEFDINVPKVRYLRIRCLENWGGSTNLAIGELQVFGDPR
ncbi:DUF4959 domain-containing protein [Sinomicrobium kalidii]|uniref:DUF4959 domain-containing protein n=1 Tax=Sinomicrobium kalidii TaxID=2900738 RepID=UPI001E537DF6|nr:DUF4959 domain-containing protein [Sinomicrobium kalidii]UGU18173.1 DUF4959 domain-containing protein [Sinomicrobium kalidii]